MTFCCILFFKFGEFNSFLYNTVEIKFLLYCASMMKLFSLQLRTNRRTYNFCAADAATAQEWIEKVQACLQ